MAAKSLSLVAVLWLPFARAITKELYTTNAVCKQRYCVNPIFPGLLELQGLDNLRWYKQSLADVTSVLDFCGGIVDYDPALPAPNSTTMYSTSPVEASAIEQDRAAAQLYFYHLAGMGIEPWDHVAPLAKSPHPLAPCAKEVARMACFTYFPKAFPTAAQGQEMSYLRPCSSCCAQYVQACNVECCDESVSCVFTSQSVMNAPPNAGASSGNGDVGSAMNATSTAGTGVAAASLAQVVSGFTLGTAPSVVCTGTASTPEQSA